MEEFIRCYEEIYPRMYKTAYQMCIRDRFSAHVMRHTACTRMAECRMDVKVLQYIMGHAHIDVTMEVYNHIGELTRIEKEIARLDSMALNA